MIILSEKYLKTSLSHKKKPSYFQVRSTILSNTTTAPNPSTPVSQPSACSALSHGAFLSSSYQTHARKRKLPPPPMRIGDPFRILITPAAAAAARYHPLHQAKPLLILSHALHPTRTRTRILITRTDTNNMSTISAEDDAKYGFTREEMYKEKLAGTVNPYGRHVFLCFKGPEMWVARVEASDTDTLPKLLASALKTRKDDMTVKVSFIFLFFSFEKIMRLID